MWDHPSYKTLSVCLFLTFPFLSPGIEFLTKGTPPHLDLVFMVMLKGIQSKGASWPENKVCKYWPLLALVDSPLFIPKKYFGWGGGEGLLQIWAPQHIAILVCSLPMRSRKKVGSWPIWYTCHPCQPCSWRHWHKLLGTKWQNSHVLTTASRGFCA